MEKIKKFSKYIFSNEFLLKVLIIFAIISLANGEFPVRIWHGGQITIDNSYGAFDLNIKSAE